MIALGSRPPPGRAPPPPPPPPPPAALAPAADTGSCGNSCGACSLRDTCQPAV